LLPQWTENIIEARLPNRLHVFFSDVSIPVGVEVPIFVQTCIFGSRISERTAPNGGSIQSLAKFKMDDDDNAMKLS